MKTPLGRRSVLKLFAKGALGLAVTQLITACTPRGLLNAPLSTSTTDDSTPAPWRFLHGVASGDPDVSSVIIWTRITKNETEHTNTAVSNVVPAPIRMQTRSRPSQQTRTKVAYEVSLSPDFSNPILQGSEFTDAGSDFTVKTLVKGLVAGQTYFYRFIVSGVSSPIGRTKTLPSGAVSAYTIALVSCSNYPFGYFNTYDAIAKDEDIDLVLHAGDYIYEYAVDEWGKHEGEQLGRQHEPFHETVSLSDYRIRHAQYKTDQGSQAMHAAHPMVCCWDDHESTNNPWRDGASNHQPDSEGDWPTRRAESVQAYYEWMPIREPSNEADALNFTRHYRLGDLGDLITLETRHTARAQQIDYRDYAGLIKTQEDADQFVQDVIGEPGRWMMSEQNQALVQSIFKASIEADRPWRVLGNASPIAKMRVPDIQRLGVIKGERKEQLENYYAQALIWKGKYNLPFYTDTWDGYPWAREQLYSACKSVGVQDLLFLSGDSHNFWTNQLADDQGDSMGVELGTAGVTSPGDFVDAGWSPDIAHKLDTTFAEQLDEVLWTDSFHQGFVKVALARDSALSQYVAVSTLFSQDYSTSIVRQVRVDKKGYQLSITEQAV